jgi:hypothetical protein
MLTHGLDRADPVYLSTNNTIMKVYMRSDEGEDR